MNLLAPIRRLFSMAFLAGEKTARPAPDDDFWYSAARFATASGIEVTAENAVRVGTVYACVRVLSETMASLPLHVHEDLGDEGSRRATQLGVYDVLHGDRPNPWQTHFEWIEMMMGHVLLRGRAFSRKIGGERGAADQLVPLHPDRMKEYRLENGRLLFEFRRADGLTEYYTQDELFWVRGPFDMSMIQAGEETIGTTIAAERHGSKVFKNYARPGVILEHPGKLKPEAKQNLRESWERVHAGVDNAHRTAVLEEGMKAHEIGMTNRDAQLLELRQYQRTEICGLFRVPPHMVGDLSKVAYNQLEHQDTAFAKHTMLPWCRRWEGAIQRDLLAGEEGDYYARFGLNGLQRGDLATRTTHYTQMLQWGVYSINEVRALEDLNPIDGGDAHFVPLNMQTLEKAVKEPEPVPAALQQQQQQPPALPAPPGKQEQEEEEEEEEAEGGGRRAALRLAIQDAAARIAAAEVRGLQPRVKHAAQDRAQFDAWAVQHYAALRGYVAKTLAPVAALCQAATGRDCDAAAIAEYLARESPRQLAACDPAETVARWAAHNNRAEDLAALLEQEWLA